VLAAVGPQQTYLMAALRIHQSATEATGDYERGDTAVHVGRIKS